MPDPTVEDVPIPPPRVEPTPRWIRVRAGATEVADSGRALLLVWFGPGMLPIYCLPAADVRTELLRPSAAPVGHPFLVNHDVVAGGDRAGICGQRFGGNVVQRERGAFALELLPPP